MIHDIKPYPDVQTALVWKFYGQSIQKHGKPIFVAYRASEVQAPRAVSCGHRNLNGFECEDCLMVFDE